MITYTQVAAVADAMTAENIQPQSINVRVLLGDTGSYGTIQRHLTKWRDSQPKAVAVPGVCPKTVTDAVNNEIAKATAEVRAELGSQLVIAQEESSNLAAVTEALEAELEKRTDEISVLSKQNDSLLVNEEKLVAEIQRLNDDRTRDRIIIEQGRTEIAQLRNKLELLEVTVSNQANSIETLQAEKNSETKKRIDAEKNAAVLAAKLEAERDKAATLLTEKAILTDQVSCERQIVEAARTETSRIAAELVVQVAIVADKTSALKESSMNLETEKKALIIAEKKVEELQEQFAVINQAAEAVRLEAARCKQEFQAQVSALAEKDTIINDLTSNLESEKNARIAALKQVSVLDKKLHNKAKTDASDLQLQPTG